MRQYAASGMVDCSGSTSVMMKSRSPPWVACHNCERVDAEGDEDGAAWVGRAASTAFSAAAADDGAWEDME